MNIIAMEKFGSTLTDRADGKKAFKEISEKNLFPVVLDFKRVVSLGSSFGDEVILKVAPLQNLKITIVNTNHVIKNSVKRIIEETEIEVTFKD